MDFESKINKLKKEAEKKSINKNIKYKNKRQLQENSVTKSNALARGYYRFTLTEKRVMESLISQLDPRRSDNTIQNLTLSSKEYSEVFSICKKTAYRDIEKAINNLMHQVITTKKENGKYSQFTLMSSAEYVDGEGVISASFNPKIIPFLQDLKSKFNSYPLKIASNFKSSYTWRMFELLSSWSTSKNNLSGWFSIEVKELRNMLGVPETYKWDSFKKQILEKSQRELKEKANIHIEYTPKKTGKKITKLDIIFLEK